MVESIVAGLGWTRSLKACIALGRVPLAVKAASVPSLAFPQEQFPLGLHVLQGGKRGQEVYSACRQATGHALDALHYCPVSYRPGELLGVVLIVGV